MRRRALLSSLAIAATGCLRQTASTRTQTPSPTQSQSAETPTPVNQKPIESNGTLQQRWAVEAAGSVGTNIAVHDGSVYTVEGQTMTARRHDDGRIRWQTQLGTEVTGGRVDTSSDTVVAIDTTGTITTFAAADGTTNWQTTSSYQYDFFNVALETTDDILVVAERERPKETTRSRLVAYDLATGASQWTVPHESFMDHYSGAFTHGRVEGLALSAAGTPYVGFTNAIYRCNRANGTIVWNGDIGVGARGDLAVGSEYVFVPVGAQIVAALAPGDGTRAWTTGDSVVYGNLAGGLTYEHEMLVGGGKDNALYSFAPETGERLWRTLVEDSVTSPPVVHRGAVIAGDAGGTLSLVDAATGAKRASTSVGGQVTDIAVTNDTVLCRTRDPDMVVGVGIVD